MTNEAPKVSATPPADTLPAAPEAINTAAGRRTRYAAISIILIAAATMACLFTLVLGPRLSSRFDLTTTRANSLNERSSAILDRVDQPIRLIATADFATIPAASLEALSDLFTLIENGTSQAQTSLVSLRSDDAQQTIAADLAWFADTQQAQITAHKNALTFSAATLPELIAHANGIANTLNALAVILTDTPQAAEALRDYALRAQSQVDALNETVESIPRETTLSAFGLDLPQTDVFRNLIVEELSQLAALASQADDAGVQLIENASTLPNLQGHPRQLRQHAAGLRDTAAAIIDRIDGLAPLEPLMIARLLQQQQAIVVLSARGAAAISIDSLLNIQAGPNESEQLAATRVRRQGERDLATAIESLTDPHPPIIVLVHAEPGPMLGSAARPTPMGMRVGLMVQQLILRRRDVVEWQAASQPTPPELSALNPTGERPVVYVILDAAPARSTANVNSAATIAEHANRIKRLADAITLLVERGESMLISLAPSQLPRVGQDDPVAAALRPLGIEARVGTIIFTKVSAPTATPIEPYVEFTQGGSDHPLAQILDGIRTGLNLAMPLDITEPPPEGTRLWPILIADDPGEQRWAESSWGSIRNQSLGRPFERIIATVPPTPNDRLDDPEGPWIIAVAVERGSPSTSALPSPTVTNQPRYGNSQRIVAVASPGWLDSYALSLATSVGGQRAARYPGNSELLAASLNWLAKQDDLVRTGTTDVARIRPLTPAQRAAIMWGLILGLPVLILAGGVVFRVIRG